MSDTSLFSLAHMLAEQEAIRVQIKGLTEKDQVLARLIEAARAYEATFGEVGVAARQPETISEQPQADAEAHSDIKPEIVARPRIRERTRRPAPVMEATENLVSSLLETMGEPIQTGQMIDLIGVENLNLPEQNPLNVLSARLSNSTKFQGRRGKGWWFANQPWPGDDNVSTPDGAESSEPLDGSDPTSGPDGDGLDPHRLAEELGLPSPSPSPGSEGHEERKEERDVDHHPEITG